MHARLLLGRFRRAGGLCVALAAVECEACKTLFLHWACGEVYFWTHCCEYVRIFIGEAVEVGNTSHT